MYICNYILDVHTFFSSEEEALDNLLIVCADAACQYVGVRGAGEMPTHAHTHFTTSLNYYFNCSLGAIF